MERVFKKPSRQTKMLMLNLLEEEQKPSIYLVSMNDSFIENPLNKSASYNYNPLKWTSPKNYHDCCNIL